MNQKKNSIMK